MCGDVMRAQLSKAPHAYSSNRWKSHAVNAVIFPGGEGGTGAITDREVCLADALRGTQIHIRQLHGAS